MSYFGTSSHIRKYFGSLSFPSGAFKLNFMHLECAVTKEQHIKKVNYVRFLDVDCTKQVQTQHNFKNREGQFRRSPKFVIAR